MQERKPNGSAYKELLFQLVLHSVVFLFYTFDRNQPRIETYRVVYFLNFAVATFVINYLLLPAFLYRKKYLSFLVAILLVITWVILIEELVLEQIYFPDTRGRSFPGLFFTLLEVLPMIVILSGFKFAWDVIGKQREVDELKAAMRESELQYLTSQINPHFLFNNLNNLYAYAIEQSPKTPEIILELSGVLRYMLYECREPLVPLDKEIEHLRHFTRLNQLQIEDRGEVQFQASAIPSRFQIAPLILIVFVENAFKHSQASQAEGIRIDMELSCSDTGHLTFLCQNSYSPTTNTEQLSRGIGLANVKKRLELLYPQAHQLDIEAGAEDFSVQLTLHLQRPVSA